MFALASSSVRLLRGSSSVRQWTKVFSSSTTMPTNNDVHLIINAVGKDRLGIVSDVTGLVIQAGGNVCDSQAARLGPYFSLIMGVTLDRTARESLTAQLAALPAMQAVVYEDEAAALTTTSPEIGYKGKFTLEGADHPGIVHKITSALASHGLSIDTMHTDQEIAPHGGAVLFKMHGIVTAGAPLAAGFDADKIRQNLEAIGDELNCDVTLDSGLSAASSKPSTLDNPLIPPLNPMSSLRTAAAKRAMPNALHGQVRFFSKAKPSATPEIEYEYRDVDQPRPKLNPADYPHKIPVNMPDFGSPGKILRWYFKEGDVIVRQDVLCDIETPNFVCGMETGDEHPAIMGPILLEAPTKEIKPGETICYLMHPGEPDPEEKPKVEEEEEDEDKEEEDEDKEEEKKK